MTHRFLPNLMLSSLTIGKPLSKALNNTYYYYNFANKARPTFAQRILEVAKLVNIQSLETMAIP